MSGNLRGDRSLEPTIDGTGRRVALVCARFNDLIVERLEQGAIAALVAHRVEPDDIDVYRVPGALEIPQVAMRLARAGHHDAVVALGAVVRGDTYHFEVVSDASAAGLMHVGLDTGVAIGNGILTVDTEQQALERCPDGPGNKGAEAALAALETATTLDRVASAATPPRG
jgi:6,7-dimethyl-8-ribityllumazine synthase